MAVTWAPGGYRSPPFVALATGLAHGPAHGLGGGLLATTMRTALGAVADPPSRAADGRGGGDHRGRVHLTSPRVYVAKRWRGGSTMAIGRYRGPPGRSRLRWTVQPAGSVTRWRAATHDPPPSRHQRGRSRWSDRFGACGAANQPARRRGEGDRLMAAILGTRG